MVMEPKLPLLVRLNWYWLLQGAGWLAVALFNLALAMGRGGGAVLAVCFWCGASGLLLSDQWHRALKRRAAAGQPFGWRFLAGGTVLLAAAQSASVYGAFALFRPFGAPSGFAWIPYAMMFWVAMFFAWTVCYMAALSVRRARRAEATSLRLELQAKEVELRALQAQVNPHFFFNSLNSMRALIYEDPESAAQMVDQLAGLMRYALQSGELETVPLEAELEAVRCYLAIEKIRFEERLRARIDVEPGLGQVRIPPMALQTLVENAVKYGVELSPTGSDIHISARSDAGAARIDVANVGAIRVSSDSTRVGLVNTRKRLELALGNDASLAMSESGGWVRATLHLPSAQAPA
jgi:hypothetical protein